MPSSVLPSRWQPAHLGLCLGWGPSARLQDPQTIFCPWGMGFGNPSSHTRTESGGLEALPPRGGPRLSPFSTQVHRGGPRWRALRELGPTTETLRVSKVFFLLGGGFFSHTLFSHF